MKELEGEWIMKKEMRMISKDGTISNFPKYTSSKEEEEKKASEIGSNSEPPGYAVIDDDVESDLDGSRNDENPDIATIIVQQLQTILPQIITQVTNNVNNANVNGGNGGNGGNDGNG
nr:hypothetical protein [Tanacetum cinerariifolium]